MTLTVSMRTSHISWEGRKWCPAYKWHRQSYSKAARIQRTYSCRPDCMARACISLSALECVECWGASKIVSIYNYLHWRELQTAKGWMNWGNKWEAFSDDCWWCLRIALHENDISNGEKWNTAAAKVHICKSRGELFLFISMCVLEFRPF